MERVDWQLVDFVCFQEPRASFGLEEPSGPYLASDVKFSPDGRYIAVSQGKHVQVWVTQLHGQGITERIQGKPMMWSASVGLG